MIGDDKCIYFPPSSHYRVLRYNPSTQDKSFIGKSYFLGHGSWGGAVLASDGYIYYIPCQANDILQIDSRHVNDKVLEIIDDIYKGHEHVEDNIYAPNKCTKDATFDEQKCCTIATRILRIKYVLVDKKRKCLTTCMTCWSNHLEVFIQSLIK